ncbi:FtsX-like permease family protein [Streptomyces sp. BI20]|uniref:FtsX-like permease family protein n=1 Tax=Streptomyces sp. BI20 TaxID=3403460 RepID=UPI003C725875
MLGFVMRRLRGRLPLAAAVLVTILVTTTVVTTLTAFTRTAGEAGLRQALGQPADRSRTTVLATVEHGVGDRASDDAALRAYAEDLFGDLPRRIEHSARSRSFALPAAPTPRAGAGEDLTQLASLDPRRVTLVAGRAPGPASAASGPLTAAVPRTTLDRLGLTVERLPAEIRLVDRLDGAPRTVLVTGVYRARDLTDPYWRLDPLGGRELALGSFTTYGPLLVDDTAFTAGGLPQDRRAALITPDLSGVDATEADRLRAETTPHGDALRKAHGFTVRTELPTLLAEIDAARTVARSTLLMGALQLLALALAALLLVARLTAERGRPERALLTARGASRRHLGLLTGVETLLLAVPAALLAPLLTPLALRLATAFGPLEGVPLDTSLTPDLWPLAVGTALACVIPAAVPALWRIDPGPEAGARRVRRALVLGSRSGADLALLALAFLAYRQLADHEGGLSRDAGGRLGADPVLVATPTLLLCAGTLLVLRALPPLARLGGRIAARGRGLGAALVGWQFARRPGRVGGPVLLLVLAVSAGVLALGQYTAWTGSQRDQAAFESAGGLRITGSELPAFGRGGRYHALPGGDRLLPVFRQDLRFADTTSTGHLLIADTEAVGDRVPLRADLRADRPLAEILAPLHTDRAPDRGIPLPGAPKRLELDVSARADSTLGLPTLSLILRDADGLTHRTPAAPVPADGRTRLSVDLDPVAGAPLGTPPARLTLAGLVLDFGLGLNSPTNGQVTVHGLAAADRAGGDAVRIPLPTRAEDWQFVPPARETPEEKPATFAAGPEGLTLGYVGGGATGKSSVLLAGPAGSPRQPLAAVATPEWLTANGARVGALATVAVDGVTRTVRIVDEIPALPTLGPAGIVIDLRALAAETLPEGRPLDDPDEWWLPAASADDPVPARAAAALRAEVPGGGRALLREELARELERDPLGAAPQTALAGLAAVSALLAAVGFASAQAASARERARDTSVLRALGAADRTLTRAALAEPCLLIGLGAAVGAALGVALVHLLVPLIVLTRTAERPRPELLVDLPDATGLLLVLAIAAIPLVTALIATRRDRDVAARLRYVEDL